MSKPRKRAPKAPKPVTVWGVQWVRSLMPWAFRTRRDAANMYGQFFSDECFPIRVEVRPVPPRRRKGKAR